MKKYDDDIEDEELEDEDLEDEDDLFEDEDEDEDDEEGLAPALRKKPSKADAPVEEEAEEEEEDDLDAEFDEESQKRRDKQVVTNFLEKRKSAESSSVEALTDLMLQGESDKLVHELAPYCSGNNEIKKAKQLLREARDRAKARITRLAGVAALTLDELKDAYEDDEKPRR